MATDSTELTFVRCPSCRSLVPAVSTRCRMCGATLEAGNSSARPEGSNTESNESRVRQKTSSHPAINIPQAEATPAQNLAIDESADSENFDPLAEYLQEDAPVEAPISVKASEPTPEPVATKPSYIENKEAPKVVKTEATEDIFGEDELADDFEELEDDWADEEPVQAPRVKNEEKAAPKNATNPVDVKPVWNEAPARAERPQINSANQQRESDSRNMQPKREDRAKVVIESGQRQFGKSSGLSFGKGKAEERSSKERQEPARQQEHKKREEQKFSNKPADNRREERRDERRSERDERHFQTRRTEEKNREQNQREASRPTNPIVPVVKEAAPAMATSSVRAVTQPVISSSDRLRGWFVSYEKKEGASTELREGKFFVTQSALKAKDMIIDNPSVSTPHALVAIGQSGEVYVQDLMSERGISVKKTNQKNFENVSDTVQLASGDRVKFGDVEFLIMLIPE